MNKFLIAGNWKMNKLASETTEFAKEIASRGLSNSDEIAILAPFTDLKELKDGLQNSNIGFGAQNVHFKESGAYTGEISVPMLKEIGVDYCIVGHSERREYFGETDETVNLKLKALLDADIIPILCVGESLEIREQGSEQAFVAGQITSDYDGILAKDASRIVVAYEPIWAIGTGKTATPDQAEEMCAFIRGVISGMYSDEIGDEVLILYGGSMNADNASSLLEKDNINGGLIGGASLKIDDFVSIAESAKALK